MKKRITITIDEEILKWINARVKTKTFANRCHAIEYCVNKVKGDGKKS